MDRNAATILLIDDDENTLLLLGVFLRQQGFAVLTAADGEEGIRLAIRDAPDLVVCDLNMPGLTGYDVLGAIRAEGSLADLPVIFLTGYSSQADRRRGMNIGADDYLTKPVDLKDLLAAIHVRLRRRGQAGERVQKLVDRATRTFADLACDLRDPLFVICGYTDLLKATAMQGPTKTDKAAEVLDRMQKAASRMQQLIAEVLFLAKWRLRRLPFAPGRLDLRSFLGRLVAEHAGGKRLRFACPAGEFPLVADALHLRQAVENVVSNGLKYSKGLVRIRLSRADSGFQIEVRDEGVGIPVSEQASLCLPFFRASNVPDTPGHGLGLCIAKSCIQQHGGTLAFHSSPASGTTVTIRLPSHPSGSPNPEPAHNADTGGAGALPGHETDRAGPSPDALARTDAGQPGSPGGASPQPALASPTPRGQETPRGIIVDADPLVRSLLRDFLAEERGVVICGEAASVADGRRLLKTCDPAMVFLEVRLPDGMGSDLLRELSPGTAVVFLSSAEDYAIQAFDCEAVDYLLKPVSIERLGQTMDRIRKRLAGRAGSTPSSGPASNRSFLVNTLKGRQFVSIHSIKTIIAYGEYAWVYWGKNEEALLRKSLKRWLQELPPSHFVRVHRHAIINLAFLALVEQLGAGRIQVRMRDTPEPVPVSIRLTAAFNRKLRLFEKGDPQGAR